MPKTVKANWPVISAPAPRIFRKQAARAYLGGVSNSFIEKAVKNCELQQIQLGSRAVGYTRESLDAYIALRIASTPPIEAPDRIAPPEVEAGIQPSTR